MLSRRVLLESERKKMRETTLQKLAEGQIVDGVVKNLTDYGAFIDLGGIDGLLHITDMSWGRVNHPSEMFQVGDEVKVKVLKFDSETERVSLGLKQIQPDPWIDASSATRSASASRGKVVSLTDYGAFVELEPGIEGLVHVSEMSWTKRVKHPSKVVERRATGRGGGARRRRARPQDLARHEADRAEPVERARGEVPGRHARQRARSATSPTSASSSGIEEGIDGLVHVSDISWTQQIKHPCEKFKKGDEVEAVVLKIDKENEKFSLGIKQLQPNPWDDDPAASTRWAREVTGEVTNVTDFGAFVRLEEGIEGLIYSSELATERVDNAGRGGQGGPDGHRARHPRRPDRAEDLAVDQSAHRSRAARGAEEAGGPAGRRARPRRSATCSPRSSPGRPKVPPGRKGRE